jgi:hypothetical protein
MAQSVAPRSLLIESRLTLRRSALINELDPVLGWAPKHLDDAWEKSFEIELRCERSSNSSTNAARP